MIELGNQIFFEIRVCLQNGYAVCLRNFCSTGERHFDWPVDVWVHHSSLTLEVPLFTHFWLSFIHSSYWFWGYQVRFGSSPFSRLHRVWGFYSWRASAVGISQDATHIVHQPGLIGMFLPLRLSLSSSFSSYCSSSPHEIELSVKHPTLG